MVEPERKRQPRSGSFHALRLRSPGHAVTSAGWPQGDGPAFLSDPAREGALPLSPRFLEGQGGDFCSRPAEMPEPSQRTKGCATRPNFASARPPLNRRWSCRGDQAGVVPRCRCAQPDKNPVQAELGRGTLESKSGCESSGPPAEQQIPRRFAPRNDKKLSEDGMTKTWVRTESPALVSRFLERQGGDFYSPTAEMPQPSQRTRKAWPPVPAESKAADKSVRPTHVHL